MIDLFGISKCEQSIEKLKEAYRLESRMIDILAELAIKSPEYTKQFNEFVDKSLTGKIAFIEKLRCLK